MEFIDKIRSVELNPTIQLGHHPPSVQLGGCPFLGRWGSVCLNLLKKMSDNIFNQNQNSLAINNNIMDYEPNVNSGSSKVILGIEKKLMAFDVDPNILKTGLNNYLIQNSILLSKSNIRDSVIIKEIISKVDQLSNNLMKVVEDIKEKFDAIEDALYKYSEYNENNINSTNVKINKKCDNRESNPDLLLGRQQS